MDVSLRLIGYMCHPVDLEVLCGTNRFLRHWGFIEG